MTERQKGIAALAFTLVAWSFSSLFVKFLMPYYDPWTQNVYRYASGMVLLLPLLVQRVRRNPALLGKQQLGRLLVPTIPNVVHQTAWVVALLWIYPALSSFLNKSSVLFAALMAFVFFPEERWFLRSKRFLSGLGLTMAGTVGLALLRPDLDQMKMNLGVLLALLAAAGWAMYSVAAKRLAEELGSTVSFSVVSIYTTLALLPMALAWGDLRRWNSTPWHVNAIMVFSGVFCIGVAHTTYFRAIKALGVSVCTTMLLTTPLGTLLISRWWFGERLTAGQIVSGMLLILGGALTLLAREKPAEACLSPVSEA
jgi:drug/metabolite transporter (DMT)-like permease